MKARDTIEAALRGAAGWGDSRRVDDLLVGHRAEVLAEARLLPTADVVAWLVKKAREFRSAGGRMRAAQADAVDALASKVERGAVRPNNLRMLPADFFEVGHSYTHRYGYDFLCVAVTTHPVTHERLAIGWHSELGVPIAVGINQWNHEYDGVQAPADTTQDGAK